MGKKQKSFKTLAEDLKALRNRKIPQSKIDEFNKIMEEDIKREEQENSKPGKQKIARPPETETGV